MKTLNRCRPKSILVGPNPLGTYGSISNGGGSTNYKSETKIRSGRVSRCEQEGMQPCTPLVEIFTAIGPTGARTLLDNHGWRIVSNWS